MLFSEFVQAQKINKKLIDQIGKYKIFLVDGEKIRKLNLYMHEFTDSANHLDFPKFIPANEIWIDEATDPKERFLLLFGSLYYVKSKDYDYAMKQERKLREIVDHVKFHPERHNGKPDERIYKSLYGTIHAPEKISVWLVNARLVRDLFKTDFTEGGHGYIFRWIPNDEIWIENTLHKHEMPLIILHEFVERTLMKHKNMKYEKAHTIASKVEFTHEDDFTKEDALALTKPKSMKPWTGWMHLSYETLTG